jgi:hypothetical protein
MKLKDFLLAELDREVDRSRKAPRNLWSLGGREELRIRNVWI